MPYIKSSISINSVHLHLEQHRGYLVKISVELFFLEKLGFILLEKHLEHTVIDII